MGKLIKWECHYGCRHLCGESYSLDDVITKRMELRKQTPEYDRFIFKAFYPDEVQFDRWGSIIHGNVNLECKEEL